MDWLIGEWLIAAHDLGVHVEYGRTSFCDYAAHIFGWNWRQALQRLDTARRLRKLPRLTEKLRDGSLAWSAVREVARVANEKTEAVWLERIEGKTVRQIESLVAGHEENAHPDDEKKANQKVHRVMLAFSQEEYERWCRWVAEEKKHCDEFASEEGLVLSKLEEKAAERTGDGSRSRCQLSYMRTLDTGKTYISTMNGFEAVSPVAAEMLECDSLVIGLPGEGAAGGKASQTIRPSVRRMCIARAGGRCEVPSCRRMHFLDLHHLKLRKDGGTDDPENLVVLCGYHHRAFHEGWLLIDGTRSTGLIYRHVTGKLHGTYDAPSQLRHANGVLQFLLNDGLPEHEARQVLALVWPHVRAGTLTIRALEAAIDETFPIETTLVRYGLPPDENGNTTATFVAPAHVGSDSDAFRKFLTEAGVKPPTGMTSSRPAT